MSCIWDGVYGCWFSCPITVGSAGHWLIRGVLPGLYKSAPHDELHGMTIASACLHSVYCWHARDESIRLLSSNIDHNDATFESSWWRTPWWCLAMLCCLSASAFTRVPATFVHHWSSTQGRVEVGWKLTGSELNPGPGTASPTTRSIGSPKLINNSWSTPAPSLLPLPAPLHALLSFAQHSPLCVSRPGITSAEIQTFRKRISLASSLMHFFFQRSD